MRAAEWMAERRSVQEKWIRHVAEQSAVKGSAATVVLVQLADRGSTLLYKPSPPAHKDNGVPCEPSREGVNTAIPMGKTEA